MTVLVENYIIIFIRFDVLPENFSGYIHVDDRLWRRVTSMLATALRCWWLHRYHLSFKNSFGHQHWKDVINVEIMSPTPKNCHQHLDINIQLSPKSMKPFSSEFFFTLELFMTHFKSSLNVFPSKNICGSRFG